MQKQILLLAGIALCVGAVVSASGQGAPTDDAMPADNAVTGGKAVPADNSGINERDRSDRTLTPENQSESKSDIELAAAVRRAVVAQKGISIAGQNIKIIARDGDVTLRGPVQSPAERATIEKTVRKAAGKATVHNQLEIK